MTNNELKYYEKLKLKKYRQSEKKFIIEGPHLIEECIKSSLYKELIEKIIVSENFTDKDLVSKVDLLLPGIKPGYIEEKKFLKLSDTKAPQGILAVVRIPEAPAKTELKNSLILALDNINDPGNLGTILRTAYWFNVKNVIISTDSVEIYNPKVLRASQGAVFHLNIQDEPHIDAELKELHENGYSIFLTTPDYDLPLSQIETGNAVIIFGNEAGGIRKELLSNPYYKKTGIEKYSECESLNVSISAGIILYELKKKAGSGKI